MRKQKDRLDAAMPSILEGYCEKSSQPRETAEKEAKEFLQVIEDSASYQFGYNHSIAYCMLGYFCAYFRHYHPLEFLTAFLNDAANDEDIVNGTKYAEKRGIRITMPKWGVSRGDYFYDAERNQISKGISSIKYMGDRIADELHELAESRNYRYFFEVLRDVDAHTSVDARQLETLIRIDFFSEFGNQRELLRLNELYRGIFGSGSAKKISRDKIEGTPLADIIPKYSVGITKNGKEAKQYTILDMESALADTEKYIKGLHMPDLDDRIKIQAFSDLLGYVGYSSGKEEDRAKLYVLDVKECRAKKNGKLFAHAVFTKSLGSGKECRFTVYEGLYEKDPIRPKDLILCKSYRKDGAYWILNSWMKI